MITIQSLASDYYDCFEKRERTNGDKFWCIADTFNTCDTLRNMAHTAHGDMLPDDWRYSFIVEALSALAECSDLEDIYMEADIMNSDLLRWVSSHLDRASYVDDAVSEYGLDQDFSLFKVLQSGQYQEKQEVLYAVREFLSEQVEEMNEALEEAQP